MSWIERLVGVEELERRVDEMETALAKLTDRVAQLEGSVQPSTPHKCRDWSAWLDRTPGALPTLYVTGRCEFPGSGYGVGLERHEPQGINPRDLLLDLIIAEPTGPSTEVVTEEEVRFEWETDSAYESVTILPDGPTVPVRATAQNRKN